MILHIDDDRAILKAVARQLKQAGHAVISQSDPVTALHLLNSGIIPSVIVSDGCMPGMSGRELYDALPTHLQAVFVAFTGSPELFEGCGCEVVNKSDPMRLVSVVQQLSQQKDAA